MKSLKNVFRNSLKLIPLIAISSAVAHADENLQLKSFGISERFLYQPRYEGSSQSVLLQYYPEYRLNSSVSLVGSLGVGQINGVEGKFAAYQYLLGLTYQKLHPRWVPPRSLSTPQAFAKPPSTAIPIGIYRRYAKWALTA